MNAGAEHRRLEALRHYRVLDTERETVFDSIAALTALIFDAPIAIVGFIDETRHWFKSAVGTSLTQNARAASFCTHTIEQFGVFEVGDAGLDERFNRLPPVTWDGIRAYAGAPLTTRHGERIGTICVFYRAPRPKRLELEKTWLQSLASFTMRALEARLEGKDFSDSDEAMLNALELDWQPLFGRVEEIPATPRASGVSAEERLLSRIRAATPAPTLARAARLPRDRALLAHSFGDAPPGRVWQAWMVEQSGARQKLMTFTGSLAAFNLPAATTLLLLSDEHIGAASSHPERILASGILRAATGSSTPLS
jgi:GAF domain-containing protein